MLTPLIVTLAAGLLNGVLKSPSRPLGRVTAPERLTPATARSLWHPSVPLAERFEAVTVLDRSRTVRIVEVFGARRELIFAEVAS